ncbi:hypothetical protein SANTM175S_04196 [Streptomyces antimycoticus]
MADSTRARSTERVSVTVSPMVRFPSWRTAPEECAAWL